VVTRRFTEVNSVLGGNPAQVVRRNVHWIRNKDFIDKNSKFMDGFRDYQIGLPAHKSVLAGNGENEPADPTLSPSAT
jgi:hypothetical protein